MMLIIIIVIIMAVSARITRCRGYAPKSKKNGASQGPKSSIALCS
jgi:hypothetical protein